MLLQRSGYKLYYDLVGPDSGEVICFAHALAADGGMWAEQVPPLLSAGFRVLRLDMRGHGGSSIFGERCSIQDLAADVIGVLDHLRMERVHFVGLSIGGIIGQAIAINHVLRLQSLILSDTNSASPPNAKDMWVARVASVREARSASVLADAMMPRLLSDAFKSRSPVRWNQVHQTIGATQPAGIYACAHALGDFDFTPFLPKIDLPVMVVCGQNDPATPPSEAKKLVKLIPQARYEEIPDALHFPNVEQPGFYADVMLNWFKK